MKNPMNNKIFKSEDLIEYHDYLREDMLELWNNFAEVNPNFEPVDHISEVDFWMDEFKSKYTEEVKEWIRVEFFYGQLENYGDFHSGGATIIHEDYFRDYIKDNYIEEVIKSIYSYIFIDIDKTVQEFKRHYMEADYKAKTYYMHI